MLAHQHPDNFRYAFSVFEFASRHGQFAKFFYGVFTPFISPRPKDTFPQRIIVNIQTKAKTPVPNAKGDLKSLPLPEVGRDQRRQTGVNRAGAKEDFHCANDSQ